ncbi:hypothetical protein [Rhizosaccharibacter radicis]|uniref:Serine/threonine protein kinase n=1 Tax=Rhizosaccharibacter radicis TaxID=2782605 RepID=A0ABT1W113_9PROT|nr:hypothetical protein [Acetobacteraceae bacterium KSS12]
MPGSPARSSVPGFARAALLVGLSAVAGCADVRSTTLVAAGGTQAPVPPPRKVFPMPPPEGAHLTGRFTAPANRRSMINAWFDLNADCSTYGITTVRLASPPGHGTAEVMQGRWHPNYPRTNQRYACNLKPADGVALFYTPAPGFTGKDVLDITLITPHGRSWDTTWLIDVR